MTQDVKTPLPPAASSPTASGKRYLSQLMDHAFREGWRTPDDFVRYFPAQSIMGALKGAPELRVKLLAAATGIYEEILRRKTPALAAEACGLRWRKAPPTACSCSGCSVRRIGCATSMRTASGIS
jgi:hypothetical protein